MDIKKLYLKICTTKLINLNNLKDGLISNIESIAKTARTTHYKTVNNTTIWEEDSENVEITEHILMQDHHLEVIMNNIRLKL